MNSNLILNIPHASTELPRTAFPKFSCFAAQASYITMLNGELLHMTDWYTDGLFINGLGIPIVAPVSRIVCDTERFRDDESEPMSKIGMGVCYTKTHDLKHSLTWGAGHKEWVLENIYDVHHQKLEFAVDNALKEFGNALILDCHSFHPTPLPYEPDLNPERPDICIGTDSFHTPNGLETMAVGFFKSKGYSVKVNSPYSGTIVPMKHYHKDKRVQSLMIELNRGLYLKQRSKKKNSFFHTLKQHLMEFEKLITEKTEY